MEKETTRVEAFSDGVFAIALTLLILGIKVPDFGDFATNHQLFHALLKLWPSFLAFILSFAAVLIMWINHHGFFKYLRKINSFFLIANGLLLLAVTFINYPTAILARYFNTPAFNIAAAFYCGSMVIISATYNLMWFSSAYKRRLVKDEITDTLIIKIRNAYWIGFFIYLAAFVISYFLPYLGITICISLWIFWLILDYDQKTKRTILRRRK
ncbi:MAG: TMEM175 family protein [Bacteroidota bacterium]